MPETAVMEERLPLNSGVLSPKRDEGMLKAFAGSDLEDFEPYFISQIDHPIRRLTDQASAECSPTTTPATTAVRFLYADTRSRITENPASRNQLTLFLGFHRTQCAEGGAQVSSCLSCWCWCRSRAVETLAR